MAPRPSEFDREMQQLEAEMKQLEADYTMFFAGRLPRLPLEARARLDALVKRFDRTPLTNTAQRFRFATLQSRYAKLCEVWARTLKAREEGPARPVTRRSAGPARPLSAPPPPAEPGDRVVHVAAFRNPSHETERLRELYGKLVDARAQTGEHPVPFDRLVEVVQRQVDRLGGQNAEVVFRVLVEDGKVTLTAKRRDVGR